MRRALLGLLWAISLTGCPASNEGGSPPATRKIERKTVERVPAYLPGRYRLDIGRTLTDADLASPSSTYCFIDVTEIEGEQLEISASRIDEQPLEVSNVRVRRGQFAFQIQRSFMHHDQEILETWEVQLGFRWTAVIDDKPVLRGSARVSQVCADDLPPTTYRFKAKAHPSDDVDSEGLVEALSELQRKEQEESYRQNLAQRKLKRGEVIDTAAVLKRLEKGEVTYDDLPPEVKKKLLEEAH